MKPYLKTDLRLKRLLSKMESAVAAGENHYVILVLFSAFDEATMLYRGSAPIDGLKRRYVAITNEYFDTLPAAI